MINTTVNILFIADIIGTPGLNAVMKHIQRVKQEYAIDFCIANGENGAGGKGLTYEIAQKYYSIGIDMITSGNHIFDKNAIYKYLDQDNKIIRPINYPKTVHGRGSYIAMTRDNIKIGVINAQGRTFMYPIDCPFRMTLEEVNRIRAFTPIILIDFHAEATAEKVTMGHFMDGKVSAVIGTHTHVQTADETILSNGTAYITDVGMTGPIDSVIGLQKDVAIKRFLNQIPVRYQVADGDAMFCAVVVTIDRQTGKAMKIIRLRY